jgi:uncharacterized protein with von Willebrand factor type A (vWA) domain
MFTSFLYRLREFDVPVGVGEAITLAAAMSHGLHEQTLDGFYYTARATLIHHEGHLDAFDQAFLAEFKGIEFDAPELTEELQRWLDEAAEEFGERDQAEDADFAEFLSDEDIAELRRKFEERMAEQTERHDGGNYWVGTQGTSQFGHSGKAKQGISTQSSGGGRAALHAADARHYRGYRSDIALDIRQFEVALRRLRAFVREGAEDELDIQATIDATAANAGDIDIVVRPPSKPNTHVILMIDVGGSMFPYSQLMSQLFSATKKATHFKDLRTYYFHNMIYGKVYESDRFTDPVWIHNLMRECANNYKLIIVGDAYMAPYELGHSSVMSATDDARVTGLEWLQILVRHFRQSAWLNPEPQNRWRASTIEQIAEVIEMYPMTVDGLTEAMTVLNRGSMSRR